MVRASGELFANTMVRLEHAGGVRTEPMTNNLMSFRIKYLAAVVALAGLLSCGSNVRRSGVPPAAQAVLDTSMQDLDAGNYDKVYQEAAEEWRQQVSLEDSRTRMQQLRDAMGKVRTRSLQSAREEQTSTAPVPGHSLTAFYQTTFDKGPGMEAFVLIEHGGRWYLAKYYVTSSGSK